jgi:hypothetical protein
MKGLGKGVLKLFLLTGKYLFIVLIYSTVVTLYFNVNTTLASEAPRTLVGNLRQNGGAGSKRVPSFFVEESAKNMQ